MRQAEIDFRAIAHAGYLEVVAVREVSYKGAARTTAYYGGQIGEVTRFTCPAGTARPGYFTDAMGSDCMIPPVGRTRRIIRSIGRGLERADRRLAAAEIRKRARVEKRREALTRVDRRIASGIDRVGDRIEAFSDRLRAEREGRDLAAKPAAAVSGAPSVPDVVPDDLPDVKLPEGKFFGSIYTTEEKALSRFRDAIEKNPDSTIHIMKSMTGGYRVVDDDKLKRLGAEGMEVLTWKDGKYWRKGEEVRSPFEAVEAADGADAIDKIMPTLPKRKARVGRVFGAQLDTERGALRRLRSTSDDNPDDTIHIIKTPSGAFRVVDEEHRADLGVEAIWTAKGGKFYKGDEEVPNPFEAPETPKPEPEPETPGNQFGKAYASEQGALRKFREVIDSDPEGTVHIVQTSTGAYRVIDEDRRAHEGLAPVWSAKNGEFFQEGERVPSPFVKKDGDGSKAPGLGGPDAKTPKGSGGGKAPKGPTGAVTPSGVLPPRKKVRRGSREKRDHNWSSDPHPNQLSAMEQLLDESENDPAKTFYMAQVTNDDGESEIRVTRVEEGRKLYEVRRGRIFDMFDDELVDREGNRLDPRYVARREDVYLRRFAELEDDLSDDGTMVANISNVTVDDITDSEDEAMIAEVAQQVADFQEEFVEEFAAVKQDLMDEQWWDNKDLTPEQLKAEYDKRSDRLTEPEAEFVDAFNKWQEANPGRHWILDPEMRSKVRETAAKRMGLISVVSDKGTEMELGETPLLGKTPKAPGTDVDVRPGTDVDVTPGTDADVTPNVPEVDTTPDAPEPVQGELFPQADTPAPKTPTPAPTPTATPKAETTSQSVDASPATLSAKRKKEVNNTFAKWSNQAATQEEIAAAASKKTVAKKAETKFRKAKTPEEVEAVTDAQNDLLQQERLDLVNEIEARTEEDPNFNPLQDPAITKQLTDIRVRAQALNDARTQALVRVGQQAATPAPNAPEPPATEAAQAADAAAPTEAAGAAVESVADVPAPTEAAQAADAATPTEAVEDVADAPSVAEATEAVDAAAPTEAVENVVEATTTEGDVNAAPAPKGALDPQGLLTDDQVKKIAGDMSNGYSSSGTHDEAMSIFVSRKKTLAEQRKKLLDQREKKKRSVRGLPRSEERELQRKLRAIEVAEAANNAAYERARERIDGGMPDSGFVDPYPQLSGREYSAWLSIENAETDAEMRLKDNPDLDLVIMTRTPQKGKTQYFVVDKTRSEAIAADRAKPKEKGKSGIPGTVELVLQRDDDGKGRWVPPVIGVSGREFGRKTTKRQTAINRAEEARREIYDDIHVIKDGDSYRVVNGARLAEMREKGDVEVVRSWDKDDLLGDEPEASSPTAAERAVENLVTEASPSDRISSSEVAEEIEDQVARIAGLRRPVSPAFQGDRLKRITAEADGDPVKLKELLNKEEIIYFDFETTGAEFERKEGEPFRSSEEAARMAKPIQVAMHKVKGGEVIESRVLFMNPDGPLAPFHASGQSRLKDSDGKPISDEFLGKAMSTEEAFAQISEFLGEDPILAAHNIEFDGLILRNHADKIPGFSYEPGGEIDTLPLAREVMGGDSGHRLEDVARRFGIEPSGGDWHDASVDAEVLPKILNNLLDEMASTRRGTRQLDPDRAKAEFDAERETFDGKLFSNVSKARKSIEPLTTEKGIHTLLGIIAENGLNAQDEILETLRTDSDAMQRARGEYDGIDSVQELDRAADEARREYEEASRSIDREVERLFTEFNDARKSPVKFETFKQRYLSKRDDQIEGRVRDLVTTYQARRLAIAEKRAAGGLKEGSVIRSLGELQSNSGGVEDAIKNTLDKEFGDARKIDEIDMDAFVQRLETNGYTIASDAARDGVRTILRRELTMRRMADRERADATEAATDVGDATANAAETVAEAAPKVSSPKQAAEPWPDQDVDLPDMLSSQKAFAARETTQRNNRLMVEASAKFDVTDEDSLRAASNRASWEYAKATREINADIRKKREADPEYDPTADKEMNGRIVEAIQRREASRIAAREASRRIGGGSGGGESRAASRADVAEGGAPAAADETTEAATEAVAEASNAVDEAASTVTETAEQATRISTTAKAPSKKPAPADLPVRFGTTPVPEGYTRLYVRTPQSRQEILRDGLNDRQKQPNGRLKKVPNAQDFDPDLSLGNWFEGDGNMIELIVPKDDPRIAKTKKGTLSFTGEVSSDELIGVHEPWQGAFHALNDDDAKREAVLRGEYDEYLDNSKYAPAVRRIYTDAGAAPKGASGSTRTSTSEGSTIAQSSVRKTSETDALPAVDGVEGEYRFEPMSASRIWADVLGEEEYNIFVPDDFPDAISSEQEAEIAKKVRQDVARRLLIGLSPSRGDDEDSLDGFLFDDRWEEVRSGIVSDIDQMGDSIEASLNRYTNAPLPRYIMEMHDDGESSKGEEAAAVARGRLEELAEAREMIRVLDVLDRARAEGKRRREEFRRRVAETDGDEAKLEQLAQEAPEASPFPWRKITSEGFRNPEDADMDAIARNLSDEFVRREAADLPRPSGPVDEVAEATGDEVADIAKTPARVVDVGSPDSRPTERLDAIESANPDIFSAAAEEGRADDGEWMQAARGRYDGVETRDDLTAISDEFNADFEERSRAVFDKIDAKRSEDPQYDPFEDPETVSELQDLVRESNADAQAYTPANRRIAEREASARAEAPVEATTEPSTAKPKTTAPKADKPKEPKPKKQAATAEPVAADPELAPRVFSTIKPSAKNENDTSQVHTYLADGDIDNIMSRLKSDYPIMQKVRGEWQDESLSEPLEREAKMRKAKAAYEKQSREIRKRILAAEEADPSYRVDRDEEILRDIRAEVARLEANRVANMEWTLRYPNGKSLNSLRDVTDKAEISGMITKAFDRHYIQNNKSVNWGQFFNDLADDGYILADSDPDGHLATGIKGLLRSHRLQRKIAR